MNLFDLWCRIRWLKRIDNEIKKRKKCYEQYKKHDFVAKALFDEYKKRYPIRIREMVGESDG